MKGIATKAGDRRACRAYGEFGWCSLFGSDMQFDIVGLYRNANMLSICEGTADKMAGDVLRAVFGKTSKRVMAAMDLWMSSLQSGEGRLKELSGVVGRWWEMVKKIQDYLGNN
jgi:hypothetical protein